MRKISIGIALLVFILSLSCERWRKPEISIISPEDFTSVGKGETVKIRVNTDDPDGRIVEVHYFIEESGITSTVFPYDFEWDTKGFEVGTYLIRARAVDEDGLEDTDRINITIEERAPTVETQSVEDISLTSARVGGSIVTDGGLLIKESGVYWGINPDPSNSGQKLTISGAGNTFTGILSNLTPDQVYYVQAYARNDKGESLGEVVSFISNGSDKQPVCNIVSPTNNESFGKGSLITIEVNATDPDGRIEEVQFFINGIGMASTDFPYRYVWNTKGFESGSHIIKAVAIDNQGIRTEDIRTIEISVSTPVVTTLDATDISLSAATLGGIVLTDGGATISETGIYYGTQPNPELTGTRSRIVGPIDNFTTQITALNTNTTYYVKAYASNNIGTGFGNEIAFVTYGNEIGVFTDPRDNNEYDWVKIGNQTWMAENLAYLPRVFPPETGSPYYKYYYVYDYAGSNISEAKATSDYQEFGVLYNWEAALVSCPVGWHLPTDEEWIELERNLGMTTVQAENAGWRGTDQGRLMRSTQGWFANGNGNNRSDFTALPAGLKQGDNTFAFKEKYAYFWSATEYSTKFAWMRSLYYQNSGVYKNSLEKDRALSVRCVKD